MEILIVSGSLNPESHSRVLARAAEGYLAANGARTRFIDLRDYALPLCDGDAAYGNPLVEELSGYVRKADAILVGVPIYNYYVNAAVKNLVELTGSAWEDKLVGFFCAAGGRSSYMSVMDFASELMLDFRSFIIPRFVYAVNGDFSGSGDEITVANPEILERLQILCNEALRLANALSVNPDKQPI